MTFYKIIKLFLVLQLLTRIMFHSTALSNNNFVDMNLHDHAFTICFISAIVNLSQLLIRPVCVIKTT